MSIMKFEEEGYLSLTIRIINAIAMELVHNAAIIHIFTPKLCFKNSIADFLV